MKSIYKLYTEEKYHFGLQFLLTGILSVYYDTSRQALLRPGFTSSPQKIKYDDILGKVDVLELRGVF